MCSEHREQLLECSCYMLCCCLLIVGLLSRVMMWVAQGGCRAAQDVGSNKEVCTGGEVAGCYATLAALKCSCHWVVRLLAVRGVLQAAAWCHDVAVSVHSRRLVLSCCCLQEQQQAEVVERCREAYS
jgi:hypothetical protein